MELNTATFPVFVRLAGVKFEKIKNALRMVARGSGLFREEAIPAHSGNTRDYQEIDHEQYASFKGEGGQSDRARVVLGYNKLVTNRRFSKDIGITYEMRSQNKYPEVVAELTKLAKLAPNKMELDLQHRIGFGLSTAYTDKDGQSVDVTVGDALALFSTAHLLTGTATTYRNRLAGNPVLSKGALEGMERLVTEETLNNLGEKIIVPFDILWTTDDPNTVNTALEYLKSVAAPDFANSGVTNVYQAKYKHVKLDLVPTTAAGLPDNTKRRYWGIASSEATDAHLGVWESPHLKTPSDLNAGEEFSTDDWNFGVRAGWGIGIVTGRWIKFSSGDASA